VDFDLAVADATSLAAADQDDRPRTAHVTVVRDAGALFDGIDFAAASADQIAARMLDNLVGTATMRVELSPAP
jgi:hypothetical protein